MAENSRHNFIAEVNDYLFDSFKICCISFVFFPYGLIAFLQVVTKGVTQIKFS